MKKYLASILIWGIAGTSLTSLANQDVMVGKAVPGAIQAAPSQVTASITASTLVIARKTRTSCLVRNTDATISVYIGTATVTSANGMILKAGESVVITGQNLWQVIAASGSPVIAIIDEFN